MRFKQAAVLCLLVFALALIPVASSGAAPLPDNCTKEKGTVVCETFDGPGKNQAGVGTTTETTTQGNTSNFSPEPQDPGTDSSCNPPSSNGKPCNP
jgi:hypothetical protein